jgi:DNA-binding NarL/FixJ family response regulator
VEVQVLGGSAPYREAIADRLVERGFVLADPAGPTTGRHVVIVCCEDDERWNELGAHATNPDSVVVAVLPTLVLDDYIRALVAGASGVVYIDTPTATMADAIEASIEGEVLLPRQAAQSMAALARRERPSTELDDLETTLLGAVAAGRTIVGLAKELHYSERTVRRHLQSLYIKIGVENRAEAIAYAARQGIGS